MENSTDFLQFLIHEDIYLIDHEAAYTLVSEEEIVSSVSEKTDESIISPTFNILQSPAKAVVILFENKLSTQMPEAEKEYLGKILVAVKKSFDDVQLINTAAELTVKISEAKFIVSFDAKSDILDRYSNKYQLIKDGPQILKADKLATISQSPELRKSLWGALQEMFLT